MSSFQMTEFITTSGWDHTSTFPVTGFRDCQLLWAKMELISDKNFLYIFHPLLCVKCPFHLTCLI